LGVGCHNIAGLLQDRSRLFGLVLRAFAFWLLPQVVLVSEFSALAVFLDSR
jgi:hypothetical protein